MNFLIVLGAIALITSINANSAEIPAYQSKYVGEEQRSIKSLSTDDIEQLKHGKGWGLAKVAELNGMPGPSHILQMKDKIALSKEQEAKIQALFDDMQSKELNDSFVNRTITTELLSQQLEAIAEVSKKLRYVHLVTHLMTPNILTPQQIDQYNRLRGYNSADPCKNIPFGHDPEMWKMHNNCK